MSATASRLATGTTPHTAVFHITRKVQADLLAIGAAMAEGETPSLDAMSLMRSASLFMVINTFDVYG